MGNFVQKLWADRALTKRKNHWTLKIIAVELPWWWPTKILTYLLLAFHIPAFVLQIVYYINFIKQRQYNDVIQSGPQLSVTLFAIVTTFSVIGLEKHVRAFLEKIREPYTKIDVKIEDDIERASKYVVTVLMFMSTSFFIPFLAVSPFFFDVSEYLLFYRICEDIWPKRTDVQIFFKFVYWFTLPMASYLVINPALILHYVVYRFKAQCRMVCKGFEHIGTGYKGIDHVSLRHSKEYQKVMYVRLKQLIQDTIYIKRTSTHCLHQIQPVIIGIFCLGPVIEISTIIFVLNDLEHDSALWPDFLVGLVSALGISLFWTVCQLIIDETSNFLDYAAKCPWHMWDSKNRKALLLYMMNNEKPIAISVGGLFIVNYPLCIQYIRATYSFSILFFKLRN